MLELDEELVQVGLEGRQGDVHHAGIESSGTAKEVAQCKAYLSSVQREEDACERITTAELATAFQQLDNDYDGKVSLLEWILTRTLIGFFQ